MSTERRLAAILSADVAGYSRLMSEDEQGTIQTLSAYREAIGTLVEQHHGRVVDSPGDNLLAEFPNALDAVQCAVEIQAVLRIRNQSTPENRRMLFRIGVHLGDITAERDRVYGDGVNIAARLEALAEPGGVCISATVHEQVHRRLEVLFEDLGEHEVKNIPDPLHVFRAGLEVEAASTPPPTTRRMLVAADPVEEGSRTRQTSRRRWGWMAASLASLLILAGVFVFGRPAPSTERARRYSIPLQQKVLSISHALSPDGRYIAVQAVVGRGTQIFVRALDSWDLQPLAGTEGGSGNFFWSPDSRYIAFFANEKLKKVALQGGPAEELCDVPGLLGASGAWGRHDVIVFAPSNKYEPGPLRSVRATGGESSPLTTVERGESHRFPVFLSDGQHLLYTSVGGPSPGIYLASLDDAGGRRLLADESSVHLAPALAAGGAAHLLFIREGSLMAQPFDPSRLEFTGEPFLLLEHAPYADDGAAAISASDDGTLSYLGGTNRETDSRFAWLDRSGNVLSNEGPSGPPAFASLSPDEKTMAVPRRPPGQSTTDLWLRDLTRGIVKRFTFQNAVDVGSNAVWSPDGSRIVFSANPAGTLDLFWKDTRSSSPPELLLETQNAKYVTDWSLDGRYVLYTELNPEADLWYLPLEEEGTASERRAAEPVPFLRTEFLESGGQLSPDGQWIAYVSNESGEVEVYVRPFPSGVGKRKISDGVSTQPRWSPNGRELFYLSGHVNPTLMSVAVRATPGQSAELSTFETDVPKPLFQVRANSYHPAQGTFFYSVSADGERFLVNHIEMTEDPVLNVVVNWQLAFQVSQGH